MGYLNYRVQVFSCGVNYLVLLIKKAWENESYYLVEFGAAGSYIVWSACMSYFQSSCLKGSKGSIRYTLHQREIMGNSQGKLNSPWAFVLI